MRGVVMAYEADEEGDICGRHLALHRLARGILSHRHCLFTLFVRLVLSTHSLAGVLLRHIRLVEKRAQRASEQDEKARAVSRRVVDRHAL